MMISGAGNPGAFYALLNEVGMDWTAFVNTFCEREKLDTLESAPISLWQHPLYSQSSASGAEKGY